MSEAKSEAAKRLAEARERDEAAANEDTEPTEPTVTDVPEPDQEPKPEPEPEPEQPEQPSQKQIEKAVTKAWTAAEKQANGIGKLLGIEDGELVTCPNCDFPGHVIASRPPLDPERAMLVDASMGRLAQPKLKPLPDAAECPQCDGYGRLLRPTKYEPQREAICPVCGGNGWIPTGPGGQQILQPQPLYSVQQTAPNGQQQPSDQWTPPPPSQILGGAS